MATNFGKGREDGVLGMSPTRGLIRGVVLRLGQAMEVYGPDGQRLHWGSVWNHCFGIGPGDGITVLETDGGADVSGENSSCSFSPTLSMRITDSGEYCFNMGRIKVVIEHCIH